MPKSRYTCGIRLSAHRLVDVGNEMLQGHRPLESFMKAIIVPLRKKGDSPNALDYRPISLLQTSYNLFAKVLATRLQSFLGKLIGHTQQGFVHGRQMQRSVVMMLTQLESAIFDTMMDENDSAGILLLDFAKAYYTMDRTYLLEVLRLFGFSDDFIDLIQRLHENTTAEFLVNGTSASSFWNSTKLSAGTVVIHLSSRVVGTSSCPRRTPPRQTIAGIDTLAPS